MNLPGLVFALISFSVIKFMILNGVVAEQDQPDVPTFNSDFCPSAFTVGAEDNETNGDTDDCAFKTPTCGNIIYLCIDYLGDVIYNIGIVVILIFTFVINLIVFIFQLVVFLALISVETIPEAPWYVNIIMLTPITFLIALMIFKLFRKGDDE